MPCTFKATIKTLKKIKNLTYLLLQLRAGRTGFNFWQGQGLQFFATASRQALGPIQSFIQWIPGAFSLWVKRPVREADHSPPSSAKVRVCGTILPFPHTFS